MKHFYLTIFIAFYYGLSIANELDTAVVPSATIAGNATVCQNAASPVITFTGSGGTAPYTFGYKINNGTTLFVSTTGTNNAVTISVNTSVAGTYTYTLVNVEDSVTSGNPVSATGSAVVTVNAQANANLNSSAELTTFNGIPTFRICSNQATIIDFTNASTTLGTNTNYTINWGDGTPNFTAASWNSISHTYQVGLWTLTYTITAQNGCNISKTYKVFVGNNPAVGLGNPGNTDVCISSSLTFPITGTENNPPGTTYTVTFNDGSPPIPFNHPPPASVTHIFLTSSCNVSSVSGNTTYQNSFFASIDAVNPCDQTSASVVPIRISTPPIADFLLPQTNVCTGNQICLTNSSTGGDAASSTSCSTPKLIWTISPNSGYVLASGSLGNDFGSTNTNTWVSGSNSICPVFSVSGNYTITLKIGNRCGINEIVKTICVQSILTPLFTLNTDSGCIPLAITATNNTVLTNQCSTPTYQWSVSYAAANCGTTITPIPNQTTPNASYNFTVPGIYTITLTTTNSCGSTTLSKTVTVKKPPTVSIAAINNSCGVAAINPVATINSCAPTGSTLTYAWSFPGGNPATSNTANPGTINYANPGNYTVSLIVTNECGASTTATQNFTVNVSPTITNTVSNQTICSGLSTTPVLLTATPSGTTFTWTASGTAGVSGFTPSGTGATIPAQTLTTTGTTQGQVIYVITPTFNGCVGTPFNYTVFVNPASIITTQPTSSNVCFGGTPTPLSVAISPAVAGATYQWYSNVLNSTSGGTLIAGATGSSFIPPVNSVGTLYYYAIITLQSAGCSSLTSTTAAVIVNPLPQVTTQPIANQSICVGGIVPAFNVAYTGGQGTATYQWFSNTSASNVGGTAIVGATASTYTPPTFTTVGAYYYYVQISLSGSGCGNILSEVATVTVVPDPVINSQPLPTQTQCQGSAASPLEVTISGGIGTISYQWFSNSVNNTTTGTAISGATGSSFTPLTSTVGTTYYYVVATQNTSGCSVVSATATVIIVPAPSISNQPLVNQSVCLGGTTTTLNVSYINGIGTPNYQWYSNTVNSTVGGIAIPNATASNFTPTSTSVGTLYYYVVITFDGGGCSNATSTTAAVIVNPLPEINTQPIANQSICVGGVVPAFTVTFAGGQGAATYQWFSNSSGTNVGGTAITGATASTYTPLAYTTAGTFYYYVQISLSGSGCGNILSEVATVIVVPDPIIDSQPLPTQTQCQGSAATPLEVTVNGGLGTISYQWYSNTVNSTTTGSAITGATGNSFTPPTSTVGTTYYYLVATQNASGCSVVSAIATVIIVPAPTVSSQPLATQTVCLNGSTTQLTVAYINGIGTPSYQWYSTISNNNTGGVAIVGATSNSYTPPSSTEGTLYYYVVITFDGGGCSNATSSTAEVVVNPLPEITTQPVANQSICVGGVVPAFSVTFAGGQGTATYQWFSNTSGTNVGGTAISGATASTYTPPAYTTTGSFYYYVQISLSGSGCGIILSEVAAVTVVPDPVIDSQPIPTQTQCQSSAATPLEVTISGGLGTISYQWFSNSVNNTTTGSAISGANENSFTPSTTNVGTTYYYVVVTQDVSGCSVTSTIAVVEVVPAPLITQQPQNATTCEGGTIAPLNVAFINGTGTASYQWYNEQGPISGATNASYLPSNLQSGQYYCIISFSSGGCTSITTETAIINVLPLPEIDTQPIEFQTVCAGGSIPALTVTYTGGVGNATYQWYTSTSTNNTGGTPIPGATNANYTPSVFETVGTYYFYVVITLYGSGCGAITSSTSEVNVIPDPVVIAQPLSTQTVCQNTPAASLNVSVAGGINSDYIYQWYLSSTPNIGSGTIIVGATSNEFLPPTSNPGTFYYYCLIKQTEESGCAVLTTIAEVIVNVAPEVNNEPDSLEFCLGDQAQELTFTIENGVGIPSIQWYTNTENSTIGGTPISGANSDSFTPPTSPVGIFYYYAVINYPTLTGDCSTLVTAVASVTINQVPVVYDANTTICSSNSFEISPSNELPNIIPPGTTYTWNIASILPAGSITGASDENNPQTSISQFLVNTTTNPATIIYNVTPTSGNCIGNPFQVVVTVNPAISTNVVLTNSTCFQIDNGSIFTSIVGGIPPYTLTWTGPDGFTAATTSISNLAPGTYTLLIEDTGDCPYTESFTITEPDDIEIVTLQTNNITCFGFNNGSIQIAVTGGTGAYSFTWTKNGVFYSNEQNLINLAPGTYAVTVTDENNCGPKFESFVITEPPLLEVSLLSQINVECFGDATGAIEVVATGGTITNSYTFLWSGPNGFTSDTQNLQNLIAGDYLLTVTDANGCQTPLTVTLTQSPEIIISYTTTPISCYGANDATLSVTLSGGVPPFQFTWNNLSTSLNQNNLSAGDYIITVTDAFGCVRVATINIPEAPVFMVNPIVNQITCFGANNGSINLNLTGGIPPVALTWSDGSTAGLIRNNLPPGTYTATISDGTPCFIVRTFTIIEPQLLVLSASLTQPIDCLNAASGAINLIVSGGTPPFTYQWTNGTTTEDLSGVVAGNYGVTVTDANGCVITGQYTLIRPNPLVVNVTTQTDADCETREVLQYFVAQASGGVPPYTYQWSSGTISGTNNQIMQTNTNGMVILTVTDGLGCSITYNVNVENPIIGNPSIEATSFGYLTYGIYSISDPIQFYSNATGDYVSIIWDFGDGTFSNEENPLHTYEIEKEYIVTLTVTYPFGCVYVLTISLLVEKGYFLVIPSAFTPNNDGLNDTFRPVSKRLKNLRMDVYDSWGSMIYSETGAVLIGWDGKIKGINAENGNYYSVITAETFYGTIIKENQTFVLIK